MHSYTVIEYNYCRVDYANILPELFMEVADPELPSSKGVLSPKISGNSHHSVVDREELCKFTMYHSPCIATCMYVAGAISLYHSW